MKASLPEKEGRTKTQGLKWNNSANYLVFIVTLRQQVQQIRKHAEKNLVKKSKQQKSEVWFFLWLQTCMRKIHA